MLQCTAVSATTAGDEMHDPETPTMRTILLTLPIHAWITFGSELPPWALTRGGNPRRINASETYVDFMLTSVLGEAAARTTSPIVVND
jgi:hypothetical protein